MVGLAISDDLKFGVIPVDFTVGIERRMRQVQGEMKGQMRLEITGRLLARFDTIYKLAPMPRRGRYHHRIVRALDRFAVFIYNLAEIVVGDKGGIFSVENNAQLAIRPYFPHTEIEP